MGIRRSEVFERRGGTFLGKYPWASERPWGRTFWREFRGSIQGLVWGLGGELFGRNFGKFPGASGGGLGGELFGREFWGSARARGFAGFQHKR